MKNEFTVFFIRLLLILSIVFCIHILMLYFLNFPLFKDMIVLSYVINAVLAIGIFGVLFKLKDKYGSQLGFLFLGGSFLKFIVFFVVFYPVFKADGQVTSLEFSSFFIPYIISLLFETFSLVKWLNKI